MTRKSLSTIAGFALLPGLALLPSALRAKDAVPAPAALSVTALSVVIESDSPHHWEIAAGSATLSAQAVVGAGGLLDAVSKNGLQKLDLAVAVDSLKSTEGHSMMDSNAHKTLESEKFPEIRFSMKSYTLAGTSVTAQGDLTIHGQTKAVTLTAQAVAAGDGLKVSGKYPLLQTDYGVQPFGIWPMKVGNQVTIDYDFKLAK